MNIKDFNWKAIVSNMAPALATALGGPLAGVAVSTISTALLGHPDATETDIAVALAANKDPDLLIKLKQADQAFATKIKELDIDLEKINSMDRDSARQREIKTGDIWTTRVLGTIIIIGWFGLQYFFLTHIVPTEMREIVLRGLGTLDLAVGLVLGYYFGSSSGSAHKTALMGDVMKSKE